MITTLKQLLKQKLGQLLYVFTKGANPHTDSPYIIYGEFLLGPTTVDAVYSAYHIVDPPQIEEVPDMQNHYMFTAPIALTPLERIATDIPPCPLPRVRGFPVPSSELPEEFDVSEIMRLLGCTEIHAKHLVIAWTVAGLIAQVPDGFYYTRVPAPLKGLPKEPPDALPEQFQVRDIAIAFACSPEKAEYMLALWIHNVTAAKVGYDGKDMHKGDLDSHAIYERASEENVLPADLPDEFVKAELGKWTHEGYAWNEQLLAAWLKNGLIGHGEHEEAFYRMDKHDVKMAA